MIRPNFLKPNDIIGVTAPSDGNRKDMDFRRLELAQRNLIDYGYRVRMTPDVRTSSGGRSAEAKVRAEEFRSLICDLEVTSIVFAKGGDFLMEVLPLINFEEIQKNPKWMQGFSDCTGLLYTITINCDMHTLYSNHFNDFAITPWHESQRYNLDVLEGRFIAQRSFSMYEDEFHDRISPEQGYFADKPVCWNTYGGAAVRMEGRVLGGCLDVLLNLCGTRFDRTEKFLFDYKEDGIIWYLESFSLDAEGITRGLWQLKEAGWFDTAVGFVFGRPCMFESFLGYSYEEAVMSVLGALDLPVIFNADIGHKSPQFTMINGALAQVECKSGRGSIAFSEWR